MPFLALYRIKNKTQNPFIWLTYKSHMDEFLRRDIGVVLGMLKVMWELKVMYFP